MKEKAKEEEEEKMKRIKKYKIYCSSAMSVSAIMANGLNACFQVIFNFQNIQYKTAVLRICS